MAALCAVLALMAGPASTAPGADDFAVSVVPSDDPSLPRQVPRDRELTAARVEDMVRRAVDLVGGMAAAVSDTARLVLIKPNIGVPGERRSGVISDYRVVRAVAILVHEAAPRARILIAEAAGGWASPEYRDRNPVDIWDGLYVDGFERAGHRETAAELRGRGVDIACLDLNFDDAYALTVPGGGLATDEYDIAASIVDADAWINVPVAKTHGAKITCCMKNHFGLLPGNLYGWSKLRGTEDHPGMPHTARVVDEAFVDLWTLTQVDMNVVDMITGSERGPFEATTRRQNIVLAGRDPVAADLVVARLMGYNPDDLEFADLAYQRGMGPRWLENVEVRGAALEPLVQRFVKAGAWYEEDTEWHGQANYGKGPRRWTLLGPLPKDHTFSPGQIVELAPEPGADGWSDVVWFGHDKIDLDEYYDDPVRCAAYGYAEFTMPRADAVRFWLGADERLQVWIDGEPLYDTADYPELGRRRRHRLGMVRLPGHLEAGPHRLLVRAEQNRGRFDFSFNVCEPMDDERFAGNTYPGLRWRPAGEGEAVAARVTSMGPMDDSRRSEGPAGTFGYLPMAPHPERVARVRSDTVTVAAQVALGETSLAAALAAAAGVEAPQTVAVRGQDNPFGTAAVGPSRFLDLLMSTPYRQGVGLEELARLLGVEYELVAGLDVEDSVESIREWLALGHLPVTGAGGKWVVITGYRSGPNSGAELRLVEPGAEGWHSVGEGWSAPVSGLGEVRFPVFAVAPDPEAPASPAERLAAAILDMALAPTVATEVMWWDPVPVPAGLAAWDWSVIHWERLPFTEAWALNGLNWSLLARTRTQHLEPLIADRRHCAAAMRELAAGHERGYRPLAVAAAAYSQVAALLDELRRALPDEPRRPPRPDDRMRLEALREKGGLLRQARAAERQALQALSAFLGRGPLPPPMGDPLDQVGAGLRIFEMRAEWAEGIWEYRLQGEDMSVQRLHGAEPGTVAGGPLAPVPEEPGWTLAVQVEEGAAAGWVAQQPTADNGWEARLRIDSLPAWWGSKEVAFAVWAVPDSLLWEGDGR